MGSCISKCRPKKKFNKDLISGECSHVYGKLVVSQASVSPSPDLIQKQPVSPSPSAASSTSFSSFSGGTNSTSSGYSVASSLSSSSSCSSSVSISKDRSFSNEFLWSCVKENPHIIGQSLIRGSLEKSGVSNKIHPHNLDSFSPERPAVATIKQVIPERPGGATPKKRARANSPTLVRQKSFRKEPDRASSTCHVPSRTLRSPSPSRRFNGDHSFRDLTLTSGAKEINYCKRPVISKASLVNPGSSSMRKESFRTPTANYRDKFSQQIGSRIDEIAVGDHEKQSQDVDDMVIEDINNPLIALDCFIFL